jgi:hypothetical protein
VQREFVIAAVDTTEMHLLQWTVSVIDPVMAMTGGACVGMCTMGTGMAPRTSYSPFRSALLLAILSEEIRAGMQGISLLRNSSQMTAGWNWPMLQMQDEHPMNLFQSEAEECWSLSSWGWMIIRSQKNT